MSEEKKGEWTDIYCPILKKEVSMSHCPFECKVELTDHCIITHIIRKWIDKRLDGTKLPWREK